VLADELAQNRVESRQVLQVIPQHPVFSKVASVLKR
jgi:hypothetical protein